MSSEVLPIPLDRFALAIKDLPISTLYAKARELHNSIAHLQSSNSQLSSYISSSGPDKDCTDAIRENDDTIQRMEARILAVEYEVVVERGLPWNDEEGGKEIGKIKGEMQIGHGAAGSHIGEARHRLSTNGANGGSEGMYL